MTPLAWIALAGFGITAAIDWWAVAVGHKPTEYVTKPAALAFLTGFALAVDPVLPGIRTWWVAALLLSLAGDVFLMLPKDRFVAGLGAFLLAHLAYVVGFAQLDLAYPIGLVLVVVAAVAAPLLVRLLSGPRMTAPLKGPVIGYVAAIVSMVSFALATGSYVAATGAALFMASDTLIGWRRFVRTASWMPLAIIALYHLGQLGLVLFLVV